MPEYVYPPLRDRVLACRLMTRAWGELLSRALDASEKGEIQEVWDCFDGMDRLVELMNKLGCEKLSTSRRP